MELRLYNFLFPLVILFHTACSFSPHTSFDELLESPVDYVNPYIGNICHSLAPTHPTIHLPNSLLRVYPERKDFSGVRLNGLPIMRTGYRESSAFILSPFQGDEKKLRPVISSCYDHEKLTPYSYYVYLDDLQANVNYGVSHQSAIYNIEFEDKDQPAYLVLNSKYGKLRWNGMALSGYKLLEDNTRIFLFLVPDILPQSVRALEDNTLVSDLYANGHNASLVLKFPAGTPRLNIRYGVSFISEEQARMNLEREVAGRDIEQIHEEGRRIWNNVLGQIELSGGTEDEKTLFYTALYRCYERPVCISEDGRYYSAPLGNELTFRFFDQLKGQMDNDDQFSMAQESFLHMPYLYNYAGAPWKTQKRIRKILNLWFRNDLMGMPVNKNGGEMSAFVVFSQLGFYPINPGLPVYTIGSPTFQKAKIKLPTGKAFEIIAENYSTEHKYIQSATLNGEAWAKPWFLHSDIFNGGKLVLEMGKYPNKLWGTDTEDAPPSFSMEYK